MAPTGASIDPQTLQALVSRAVLDSLSEEDRNVLLREAIQNVIQGDRYSRSVVQQAFDAAVREVALDIARTQLEMNQQLRERLGVLIDQPLGKAIISEGEELRNAIAQHIGRALLDWRYKDNDN